jgi:hypothetical protein
MNKEINPTVNLWNGDCLDIILNSDRETDRAVADLMTRVNSTSSVLRLPDEVMSSEELFDFIVNNLNGNKV